MRESFFEHVLRHIPGSARERQRQIPVRAGLALLLSWTLFSIGEGRFIPLWLAIAVAVQVLECIAMAPFIKGRTPATHVRAKILFFLASTVCMSGAYSGLACFFWMSGGFVPLTVALLILAGGMLNNVASGVDSRPLFFIGLAPYVTALAVLPIGAVDRAPALLPILVIALVLFTVAVHAIWKRTHLARRAEVTAREEAERRRAEAEEAVADRAAMAAIVSHELRTPLSAILAGAHMISHGDAPESARFSASLIVDAGRLMSGLLNDLLDNAKIEARAMTLELREFDITACLQDTARFWSAVAHQKGLGFRVPATAEPLWVQGDPHRLRQILNNLLSNAIKFTAEGQVGLSLEDREGAQGAVRLSIVVADQGPGLTDEAMQRLFTPYAQGSMEVARTYGGTGLGLTVSRDLARLMGGDITARPAPSGGAEFVLALELPRAAPAPEAEVPALALPGPGLRVLAVDDHPINRRTLELVLEPLEVTLTTAIDGVSALEILAAEAFDVVLMDVNMPGMDGVEATRRLRAVDGPNRRTPVVGFSAGVEADQVQTCLDAGMNDWIAKPLEPRRLYAALAAATEQA